MKIRIIDLLNMISKGEEVPKRIKYGNAIYDYDEDLIDYVQLDYLRFSLFTHDKEYSITDILNNEVEIIEEPKKIEKLRVKLELTSHNNLHGYLYFDNKKYAVSVPYQILNDKLNEVIDRLNELEVDK